MLEILPRVDSATLAIHRGGQPDWLSQFAMDPGTRVGDEVGEGKWERESGRERAVALVWRPIRTGDLFEAFDCEIAVGVGHVVADARAIEQG